MPNTQTITVTKKVAWRTTHEHRFDEEGDQCRCGKTEAETDGPVQVKEGVSGE
jgi:hypothetical protein